MQNIGKRVSMEETAIIQIQTHKFSQCKTLSRGTDDRSEKMEEDPYIEFWTLRITK